MNGLLSVIIPVYNCEKYLARCIDSIIGQSYENIEVIIVDDCSTDNSFAICKQYAEKDKRIRLYQNTQNSGVSATRNHGIEVSNGEYIYFIDSDDYILPGMFSAMITELCKAGYDYCVCQFALLLSNGEIRTNEQYYKNYADEYNSIDFNKLMIECKNFYDDGVVCSQWNKVYKKEIFADIRFVGRYAEDYRISDLINSKGLKVRVLKETFYIYSYQNPSSITHQKFNINNFAFLDMLTERIRLYSSDKDIKRETMLKYCNMFLEYYEKSIQQNIEVPEKNKQYFKKYYRKLLKEKAIKGKTYIRFSLFMMNPKLYHMALNIRNIFAH